MQRRSRHVYSLTKLGWSLQPILDAMKDWGEDYKSSLEKNTKIIKRYDLSFGGFTMEEKCYSKVPVFENGMAQPVFPFTDGKSGEKNDAKTSDTVRYCVYVESDYDMDGDVDTDDYEMWQLINSQLDLLSPDTNIF